MDRGLKTLLKKVLPASVRRALRELWREAPVRLRDLPADVADYRAPRRERLPPARLRRGVALTSSRRDFVAHGRTIAEAVLEALGRAGREDATAGRWLDFGCGSGRVLRALREAGVETIDGVDIDRDAVAWLRKAYEGVPECRFEVAPPLPPLDLPSGRYDVVTAISVFTHFDESQQAAWLEEITRLLRPGGLLVASTHGAGLLGNRGDLTPADRARFEATGFLFAPGPHRFNDHSAFHRDDYQDRAWGRWLELRLRVPKGIGGFQDLSVWQRPSEGPGGGTPL